jgi:hypothetical protein
MVKAEDVLSEPLLGMWSVEGAAGSQASSSHSRKRTAPVGPCPARTDREIALVFLTDPQKLSLE